MQSKDAPSVTAPPMPSKTREKGPSQTDDIKMTSSLCPLNQQRMCHLHLDPSSHLKLIFKARLPCPLCQSSHQQTMLHHTQRVIFYFNLNQQPLKIQRQHVQEVESL